MEVRQYDSQGWVTRTEALQLTPGLWESLLLGCSLLEPSCSHYMEKVLAVSLGAALAKPLGDCQNPLSAMWVRHLGHPAQSRLQVAPTAAIAGRTPGESHSVNPQNHRTHNDCFIYLYV